MKRVALTDRTFNVKFLKVGVAEVPHWNVASSMLMLGSADSILGTGVMSGLTTKSWIRFRAERYISTITVVNGKLTNPWRTKLNMATMVNTTENEKPVPYNPYKICPKNESISKYLFKYRYWCVPKSGLALANQYFASLSLWCLAQAIIDERLRVPNLVDFQRCFWTHFPTRNILLCEYLNKAKLDQISQLTGFCYLKKIIGPIL